MERPDPVAAATALVAELFPRARQAWLGGSVGAGRGTSTSDLDVTVLLDDHPSTVVERHSLLHDGWPVELFVHTVDSVRHFVAKDVERRRPTMARLVAEGVPLLDPAEGAALREECQAVLDAGPGAVDPELITLWRYTITDQLDDLAGGGPPAEMAAVAVGIWERCADLHLGLHERWSGTGKWLVRELEALDAEQGTDVSLRLHLGLWGAVGGDHVGLATIADDVLAPVGGRLWAGYRQAAKLPRA